MYSECSRMSGHVILPTPSRSRNTPPPSLSIGLGVLGGLTTLGVAPLAREGFSAGPGIA